VSYPGAVAYLKGQVDTKTFVDGSGHTMKLCPDAFGDPGPIVIKDELTAWQYSDGLVRLSIEVNDLSKNGGGTPLPADGHRIDLSTTLATCED
jgi:hypothetical protein